MRELSSSNNFADGLNMSSYALPASAMTHSHHGHVHSHSHSPSSPSPGRGYAANSPRAMKQEKSNGNLHLHSLSESHADHGHTGHNHSHSHGEHSHSHGPSTTHDSMPRIASYEPPPNDVNVLPHDHDHHSHKHSHAAEPRSKFTSLLLPLVMRWPLVHTIMAEKDSRRIFYFMTYASSTREENSS